MINSKLLKKIGFDLYSCIRYLAMGTSFLTTVMMLKVLSKQEFVSFQVVLSCFVILYWFIDLGAIDLVILGKNNNDLISKYSSGRTFRYIVFSSLTFSFLYLQVDPLLALIFVAVNTDYFNDSMITYRSVRNSLRYLILTLLVRKCAPLLFLFYSSIFMSANIFVIFLLITCIANIPWIVRDIRKLPFSIKYAFYFDNKLKLNSLQQGGNFLQNIDVPLLNFLSLSVVIPPYVLGKKLLQIGSIFGQFQVPRIMDLDIEVVNLRLVRKKLYSNFRLSFIQSIFVVGFIELFVRKISIINLNFEDRIMTYLCLLTSTLSILTIQQNALLKVLQEFRFLMVSTFSSSFVYIFSILTLMSIWKHKWLFLVPLFLNLLVELLIQKSALDRAQKNE